MSDVKNVPALAEKKEVAQDERTSIRQGKTGNALQNVGNAISDFAGNLRYHAVRRVPAPLLNNSSNLLGFAHVWTEVIMFKASLRGGRIVKEGTPWYRYPVDALVKVFDDSIKKSKSSKPPQALVPKGNVFERTRNMLVDHNFATKRDLVDQMHELKLDSHLKAFAQEGTYDIGRMSKVIFDHKVEGAVKAGTSLDKVKVSLGNRFQTRSTLAGLVVWGLSAIIPDKKESPEQVERMDLMQRNNPVGYVGERLRQAVWFPSWPDHKRQMIGLGIMVSGVCSMMGAWRNGKGVEFDQMGKLIEDAALMGKKGNVIGTQYTFNRDYFLTSVLTFMSSLPLLFASDDQRGFGGFGAWMTGRLAFLPGSIKRKIDNKEQGAKWYFGAMGAFQVENWTQALIGGAEKKPDGTIVDHSEAHRQAKASAKLKVEKQSAEKNDAMDLEVPTTKIANISQREMAMPERAQQSMQTA